MAMTDDERLLDLDRQLQSLRLAAAGFLSSGGRPEQVREAVEAGLQDVADSLLTRINQERIDAILEGQTQAA